MRPVLAIDLLCAGRALMAVPAEARANLVHHLLRCAHSADQFRQCSGARHPNFGDGTLAETARRAGLAPERTICDPEFAHALGLVLGGLRQCAKGD